MNFSTQTLGDYFTELQQYYGSAAGLSIPYAYSLQSADDTSFLDVKSNRVKTKANNTYYGYNTRKQQTITSHVDAVDDHNVTARSLKFNLFLYDLFYGVKPWELGINRKAFVFTDVAVVEGEFKSSQKGNAATISLGDQGFFITFSYYSMITGKLVSRKKVQIKPQGSIPLASYWLDLSAFISDYTGADKFFDLSVYQSLTLFGLETWDYATLTPLSYREDHYVFLANAAGGWDEQFGDSRVFQTPALRLNYTSALNSGAWVNYPLGDNPLEFTSRKLGIPHNNLYATTQVGAGTLQITSAVEADMIYAFNADIANTGINFSDLKTLYQAVQSYFPVMAANICSAYRLPRSFNALFQAKLARAFFKNETWPDIMEAAVLESLEFIKEDYSLSDDTTALLGYIHKYWNYMGADGVYYNSVSGENVKRLGVAANSAQLILDTYKQAQLDELWIAEIREQNILLEQARFQGSFELLDKSITPQPGVALTAYVGQANAAVICTGYNINIDSAGNFTTNVNYVKRV